MKTQMIDISEKEVTLRRAVARASVLMQETTAQRIAEGTIPKGDVKAVAQVAAIMAAKQTPFAIPLCHPIRLTSVEVLFEIDGGRIEITTIVQTKDRTGVEMEAMHAASTAALAVYDMCKALDHGIVIEQIALLEKEGGRSGVYRRR